MNTAKLINKPTVFIQEIGQQILQPKNLGQLVTTLPKGVNVRLIQWVLNNRLLPQLTGQEFKYLEGRQLAIEIKDARLIVIIGYSSSRLCCYDLLNGTKNQEYRYDATLSIDTLCAIELMQQTVDPDTLFFQRKLSIRGDTELAHHVKNTLDTLPSEVIPNIVRQIMSVYARTLKGS
ncbi:ubiquinone anaerobic biosynthesis accessory factor UbiT [Kangiella sediminilitoris]|uniref:Sterol-binding domain protein n=1 Tax=Kangiella sediminilitoris TaxID=1144748 RepID=A0A1B3BBG0_9GAMM|nr:SCP2 sterol-binding domain-containing protein [Kangiella sediminilitoris]AOE50133.1 Sterol-binding domain protein [Kangiella sediminilitoris]